MDEQMKKAIEKAQDAFWAAIVEEYPKIKTGDVAPHQAFKFDDACEDIVKHWVEGNKWSEEI